MGILSNLSFGTGKVGIDIGSNTMKIVEMKNSGDLELSKYKIVPIPKNMVNVNFNDEFIVDKEGFKEVLDNNLKSMGIKNQKAVVLLSDGTAVINWLTIKLGENEDLEVSITEKLNTLFPSDITNWVYNYQKLEEKKDNYTVISEAILNTNMIEIGEMMHEFKIWPHAMDVSCFNAVNVFHSFLISAENQKKNISLINMGHDSTTVMIFNSGVLKSFRIIPYAGKDFTFTISETLDKTVEEAENYKKAERFFLREYSEEQNRLDNYNIIKSVFGEIIKGIYNSFDSYLAKFREFKIHKIVLFGGGANFRNINVLLQKHLNIPVVLSSELYSLKYKGNEMSADQKNTLLPIVGGLLRDDI